MAEEKVSFQIAEGKSMEISTGKVAKLANGSCLVRDFFFCHDVLHSFFCAFGKHADMTARVPLAESRYQPPNLSRGLITPEFHGEVATSVCGLKKTGIPNGIRTRVAGMKTRCPRPLDDRDALA